MRPIRIALVLAAWFVSVVPAAASQLLALDPFLVAPTQLDNLALASFLAGNPNLANYAATALTADGTSAAIVLFETDSSASVTFQVNNAASLVAYSDTFLTTPPQTGQANLTVTNLIQVGSTWFAPVLVQGPLAGYSSNNAISLSATQGSAKGNLTVPLTIPPLVLVHGLWGDKTSLAEAEGYLRSDAPWNAAPDYVEPICYSKYLRFDAGKDPLSNNQDPCEVTSNAALQTEIDSFLATLDTQGIVGARVDVVVHSMGGLVARNYASQAKYNSLRNRMQGQLHAIVTLNTPEIGSDLANFLIKVRSETRKAPLWTWQGLLYDAVCGSANVAKCFYSIGYPINAPTLSVKSGAVYSLEPDGPSLTNPKLSGPNIANATWRVVSSTRPDDSALATALDGLIAALYSNPDGKNVPTVDSILGNMPDDAIVTVASQTNGASGNQLYTFSQLSHTSLISSILTLLGKVNDDSVTDDPNLEVEKLAACWIETTGADSCRPSHREAVAQAPTTAAVPRIIPGMLVAAPNRVTLGVPFEATVNLPSPAAVKRLSVYQQGETAHVPLETVSAMAGANGVVHLRITPKLPGSVAFGIRAELADGAVAARMIRISVVPPTTPPIAFRANDLPVLVLTLDSDTASAMAHPAALYPAPVGRIDLDSRFVRWQLVPQHGAPVIAVAPDGVIRALRPGEAHVMAQFGSSHALLRVLVRATQQ